MLIAWEAISQLQLWKLTRKQNNCKIDKILVEADFHFLPRGIVPTFPDVDFSTTVIFAYNGICAIDKCCQYALPDKLKTGRWKKKRLKKEDTMIASLAKCHIGNTRRGIFLQYENKIEELGKLPSMVYWLKFSLPRSSAGAFAVAHDLISSARNAAR